MNKSVVIYDGYSVFNCIIEFNNDVSGLLRGLEELYGFVWLYKILER